MLISESKEAEVRRLLEAGNSVREAARLAGVCRQTVDRVKASHGHLRTGNAKQGRCTVCGAEVKFPCRRCHTLREMGIDPKDF